ncbi:MAG TPA: Maf family protein [Polyangiaceae bacterium]|jgi:septum formation protein
MSKAAPLVLGSASPRRAEILKALGLSFTVRAADIAERVIASETADQYLTRIVSEKLESVARRVQSEDFSAILVFDTIVVLEGEILGKPGSASEAEALFGRLVGRTHTVRTGYVVWPKAGQSRAAIARTVSTEVQMRPASPEEVRRYARTGEGLDKAGAYAAQGIGASFIERINGSYTNVVGLPACELVLDLRSLGLLESDFA